MGMGNSVFRVGYFSSVACKRRSTYLKDETGGRRFWPVKVGKINIEALERDRDQLWAEARLMFDAGASWWITNPNVIRDAERHQRDRYQGDPWDRDIAAYVRDDAEVNMDCIMRDVLGLELGRRTPQEHARVARAQWASIDTRRVLVTGANGCTAER